MLILLGYRWPDTDDKECGQEVLTATHGIAMPPLMWIVWPVT